VSIYIFSTGTIRTFALNLIIGVLVGTYSSMFIASTILIAWHNRAVKQLSQKMHTGPQAVKADVKEKTVQVEHVQQSAEEIALATAKKKKAKEKKKKKK
ncbi:MAG: hypothetical protein PQJ60_07070, partial [Spirochaetales bacterium]|nr:hypothetical protein [Spirochaetales bacterium]